MRRWLVLVGLLGCSSSPGVFGSEASSVAVGSGGAGAGGGSGAAAGGGTGGTGTAGMGGAGGQGGACVPLECQAWHCGGATLDDGCGGELDCAEKSCGDGAQHCIDGVCQCEPQSQGSGTWIACNADPNSGAGEYCGLQIGQSPGTCTAWWCGDNPDMSTVDPNCIWVTDSQGRPALCCATR